MAGHNAGIAYDQNVIDNVHINLSAVKRRAAQFASNRAVKKEYQAAWQLRAITCIDLTTLAGDDTPANVARLCQKAINPVDKDILSQLRMDGIVLTTGAVCVYPNQVKAAHDALTQLTMNKKVNIPIASVATGFPAGQTPLGSRLEEIRFATKNGATEIDIVINRTLALMGDWKGVYDEVKQMRDACGSAHMKSILATGELGSLNNIYKASMVCMMAGSDFIKTSTGKEGVNANFVVALVMLRAIRDYYEMTGNKVFTSFWVITISKSFAIVADTSKIRSDVGFKPAGGIRTAKDACVWLSMMREELGDEYTYNNLFRIGASGLLADIERQLYHYVTGCYPSLTDMPMG